MTDNELHELVQKMQEIEEKRKQEKLEAQAEKNLKVRMLSRMDKSDIGKAFICYTSDCYDAVDVSSEVLAAFELICDILFLDKWWC